MPRFLVEVILAQVTRIVIMNGRNASPLGVSGSALAITVEARIILSGVPTTKNAADQAIWPPTFFRIGQGAISRSLPRLLQAGTICACFLRRKSEVYSRLQYRSLN
ncbi:MAG: hypothetical protein WBD79_17635 [Anaerolineae bacterium]|jgi:hypothetical protein